MRKLTKLLILIVSLVAIVQTVWLAGMVLPVRWLSSAVLPTSQTSELWLQVAVMTIAVIIGLAAITGGCIALLAPKKVNQLEFRSPNGRLTISKRAVEKILGETIATRTQVSDVKVTVKITGKRRDARVRVSATNRRESDLVSLGETIEQIIVDELTRLMAVSIKKVHVNVKPFDTAAKKRSRQPRVV